MRNNSDYIEKYSEAGIARLSSLALLVSLCAHCHYPEAQPLPDRWPLRVRITATDGKPIMGATLVLTRNDEIRKASYWGGNTVTNTKGEFSLVGVEQGSYSARVSSPGFYQDIPAKQLDAGLEWKFHAPSQRLNLTLKRITPLRILKPDGQPLAHTNVVVIPGSRMNEETPVLSIEAPVAPVDVPALFSGIKLDPPAVLEVKEPFRVFDAHTVRTDAQGFVIPQLHPHLASAVVVVARGLGSACVRKADFAEGRPPVEVRLQPGGTLRYVVREKTSADDKNTKGPLLGGAWPPLESQSVPGDWRASETAPSLGNFYWQTTWNANLWAVQHMASVTCEGGGFAEITDLLPGQYRIRMALEGYRESYAESVTVEAGKTTLAEIYLEREQPQATLEIRITDTQGEPVANTDLFLTLEPIGDKKEPGRILRCNCYRRGWTDDRGRIVLYPVQPGQWRVNVCRPQEDFLNPQRPLPLGGEDVIVEPQGSSITVALAPFKE